MPKRAESSRGRYAVTLSVLQYWKGSPSKEVTLHVVEPGTDCVGVRFNEGEEYVVFAVSREAKDYWLEENFWYGWLDLMPRGTHVLTVDNYCDSTSEAKSGGKILKALGKGRHPVAD